jgi:Mg2+ and Co2+ transporter CorA
LTFETSDSHSYNNYVIFANRIESVHTGYYDVDSGIKGEINDCDFDLFAIDRFVKQQENHVGKLNLILSQEIENIQSNNFNKAIGNRKKVIQTIFSFERFSVEFKRYRFFPIEFEFNELVVREQLGKQIEFFKDLQDNIDARIKEINSLNSLFSKEHETILSLKNLEFNKKMQDKILYLTILMIILTFIQVILIIRTSGWDIVMKFIASGICQVAGC